MKMSSAAKKLYRDSLERYYTELSTPSEAQSFTPGLINEMDALLEYCSNFQSPLKEMILVKAMCKSQRPSYPMM